jgi:hypothetical protein
MTNNEAVLAALPGLPGALAREAARRLVGQDRIHASLAAEVTLKLLERGTYGEATAELAAARRTVAELGRTNARRGVSAALTPRPLFAVAPPAKAPR